MLITDFSQIYIAAIMQDPDMSALAKEPTEENRSFLMHMTLNTVRSYVTKYSKTYGRMVIATDGGNTWRRKVFPHYKVMRSVGKEESDMDWDYVYSVGDQIKQILTTHFPYPVVGFDGAEADDVIASLTKYASEPSSNDTDDDFGGMFGFTPEPVMIISSDGDFKQLHKYKNVKQFSPRLKKLVECAKPKAELIEKIIKGDSGDSVPGIKAPDNFFRNKIDYPEIKHRQPSITQKYIDRLLKNPNDFDSEEDRKNYARNETLISFDKIPKEVYNQAVRSYLEQKDKKVSKLELMNFFISKRLNYLNENIQDFFL